MKRNNFDFMRFMAASMVVFSHSFQVTDGSVKNSADPLYILSGGQSTLGYLAVAIFFIMSGYLIFGSAEKKYKNVSVYFWHRILRIFPALTFVVLITVVFIGGITTNSMTYWNQVSTYRYFLNVFLAADQHLPGVFADNPSSWVNGPLWTLKFEFFCYIVAAFLAKTRRIDCLTLIFLFIVLETLFILSKTSGNVSSWIDLPRFFVAGGIIYTLRSLTTNIFPVTILCIIVICGSLFYGGFAILLPIFSPYVVLYIARNDIFGNWGKYGDISYGIYLISWPVQQLIYLLGFHHSYSNFLVSYPIIIIFAYISWNLIEKPALRLKNYKPIRMVI